MDIVAKGISEAWLKVVKSLGNAEEHAPRGKKIREHKNVSVTIENPKQRILDLPIRKISLPFAFGELVWYLRGRNDVKMMSYYSKMMSSFSDDGLTLNSAYGYRIFGNHPSIPFNQWEDVVRRLKEDPDSRQAIIHLHTPNNQPTKDEVCTLSLQFLIRNGKLDMVVNMRSNDIVWGFTYDVFSFTTFQELMANELGVEVGTYYHNAASMHIYEKDFHYLEKVEDLYDVLIHMTQYSTDFDYDGITLHDHQWSVLYHHEETRRKGTKGKIDFVLGNKALFAMARVFSQYHLYRYVGKNVAVKTLQYDNVFDCMMRNYLSKRNLESSKLQIVEGCDGAGKSTFIESILDYEGNDINVIAFSKPEDDFNKFIYFHTALCTGKLILDRFIYSEIVYSRTFRREQRLTNEDITMLEKALSYRKAIVVHMQTHPDICFDRLDEGDRKAFSKQDINRICDGFVLNFRVANVDVRHMVTEY